MAFKKALSKTKLGIPVPEAYMKITELRGNKYGITYTVKAYISRESADAGGQEILSLPIHFVPEGEKRWDAQAYEHAKTLPELAGSIDILEEEKEPKKEKEEKE